MQEAVGDLAQRAELLRQAVDQVAALRVAFILQALDQPVIEALLQQIELGE